MADPGVSHWLKAQIVALNQRDPVQAVNDAELLAELMRDRYATFTARVRAQVDGTIFRVEGFTRRAGL